MEADVSRTAEVLPCHRERFRAGVDQMQMGDAWRDQRRPAPGAAADVDAGATARRQQMPRENAKIIVEYLLALLLRQVLLILPERRPLLAEAARHLRVEIFVRAKLHEPAPLPFPSTRFRAGHRLEFLRPARDRGRSPRDRASHSRRRRPQA